MIELHCGILPNHCIFDQCFAIFLSNHTMPPPDVLPSLERPVPLALLPLLLPLVGDRVQAGFPSPAEDFNCTRIDLTEQLVRHPQATFLLRVRGDSMRDAGIFDGDVLVVDRAVRPLHGHIVVGVLDGGDFTVKYLYKRAGQLKLRAANPTFPDIVPRDGQVLEIWGVVTASIKQFKS